MQNIGLKVFDSSQKLQKLILPGAVCYSLQMSNKFYFIFLKYILYEFFYQKQEMDVQYSII